MAQKPALVVMAAGLGSRYGGLKQIDPITPQGEVILDFSVFDAQQAGFGKCILIIKRELEKDFEQVIGQRLRRQVDFQYAYQNMDDLPQGFTPPPGRVKPWGTAHAVRSVRHLIQEPFAVINADDFYGADAFRVMYGFLTCTQPDGNPSQYAMVGYQLGNTLTDYGSVSRGVCRTEEDILLEIHERKTIVKKDNAAAFTEDGGQTWQPLPLDTPVSMQFFGFQPDFMAYNEKYFTRFLQTCVSDPMTGECCLPWIVECLIEKGEADFNVLHSRDRWFGVTYPQDKPGVTDALAQLRRRGIYPPVLWA